VGEERAQVRRDLALAQVETVAPAARLDLELVAERIGPARPAARAVAHRPQVDGRQQTLEIGDLLAGELRRVDLHRREVSGEAARAAEPQMGEALVQSGQP
jgi:hypothetical protein